MNRCTEFVDFAAPAAFGMHHFYVEIPPSPNEAIYVYEDFGFDGDELRRETRECRLVLARELWAQIRDEARRDFNTRLKAKKMVTGNWNTGKIRLDRFLGRELCVLGWAAEHARTEECPVICQKWLALRPEERWWLYSKTASEAGQHRDTHRGWRKALYCALSDGTGMRMDPRTKPRMKKKKVAVTETMSLFNSVEKGNI